MLETYSEMKARHQKEVNDFPIGFAFSNEQLKEEMERLRVKDESEICSIGCGGFIRKLDVKAYRELSDRIHAEERQAMKDDDFLVSMFEYEMGNHEYQLTLDAIEVINACGIDMGEFYEDERMQDLFIKAKKHYLKLCDENNWY